MGTQKDSKFYDLVFSTDKNYGAHYTNSRYFGLWKEVLKRISLKDDPFLLDLCCGPGQFALFLKDNGFIKYLGIDFSATATKMAMETSDQDFMCADIWHYNIPLHFDIIFMLECLEHLNADIPFINRVPVGKKVIATVPKFSGSSHVRFFKDKAEVVFRYSPLFTDFEIEEFKYHILFSGIKNGNK